MAIQAILENVPADAGFVQQSDDFAVPTTVINKSKGIAIEITENKANSEKFREGKITELANLLKAEFGNESEKYTDRNPLYILKQVKDRIRSEYELGVLGERKKLRLPAFTNTRTIGNLSGEVISELRDDHCIHFNAKGEAPAEKVLSKAEVANLEAKQAIKDAKKALVQDVTDTFDEAHISLKWLKARAKEVRDDNGRAEYTTDAKVAVDALKKIHKALLSSVDKLSAS
jgi:hypothetical protein